jgi:glucosamine-6-phosphate deaminase
MALPLPTMHCAGMQVFVCPDSASACLLAADRLVGALAQTQRQSTKLVLGLATGSTPEKVYEHLVRAHGERGLSFRNVITYNLDEYYPISPLDPSSYHAYMHRHLFSHVDISPDRAHVLDGTVPRAFAAAHAAEFERWIQDDGGLDIQLLGIGRNGHIGFNEPVDLPVEDALQLGTRLVELHPVTLADAAKDFGAPRRVITQALTLGVAAILAARSILVLATGRHKAAAVAAAIQGPMTSALPASLLQSVPGRVVWVLDQAAASGMS